jgi:hypothetical protein
MPERIGGIPGWAWIAGAVLIVLSVFMGYRLVQAQQQLAASQIELENSEKGAEKASGKRRPASQIGTGHIGPQINGIPARRDAIST